MVTREPLLLVSEVPRVGQSDAPTQDSKCRSNDVKMRDSGKFLMEAVEAVAAPSARAPAAVLSPVLCALVLAVVSFLDASIVCFWCPSGASQSILFLPFFLSRILQTSLEPSELP